MRLETVLIGCLAMATLPTILDGQEKAVDFEKFVAEKSPTIVTVKMVITTELGFGDRAQTRNTNLDLTGVVVDETGLVMIAADQLTAAQRGGGGAGGGRRGGGGGGGGSGGVGGGGDVEVKPSKVQVMIPGDEKEHPGLLVSTDATLHLAFVQILELGERKLSAVPFEPGAKLKLGQELIGVGRHGSEFGSAAFFGTVRITGEITQPRSMYSFDGRFASRGIPLFNHSGNAVGVLSNPAPPQVADTSGGGDRGGRGGFGGAGRAGGAATAQSFLIPAASVKVMVKDAMVKAKQAKEFGKTEPDA